MRKIVAQNDFGEKETFEKWIGVEVSNLDYVPEKMDAMSITSGRYLVIDFKGSNMNRGLNDTAVSSPL